MGLEIVCAFALLYGLVRGWLNGLVKELLSMGGFLAGFAIAYYLYTIKRCNIWELIFITIVAPILLGWIASLITKLLDQVPVIGFLNRLLGAVIGCVKWGLLIGFILLMIEKLKGLSDHAFFSIDNIYAGWETLKGIFSFHVVANLLS